MPFVFPNAEAIPLGVVVRRTPGVTRWAKWAWRVCDVLAGAGPADWKPIRNDADVTDFHAATRPLNLFVSDAEAYAHELQSRVPSVYIVLRPSDDGPAPWTVALVTVSPYEAQDYCDSAEELVEKVPMPDGMHAWISDFVQRHLQEEPFVKRKRRNACIDRIDDGKGDARISQVSDVYRAPRRKEVLN